MSFESLSQDDGLFCYIYIRPLPVLLIYYLRMFKKLLYTSVTVALFSIMSASASEVAATLTTATRMAAVPTITTIGQTSATLSLSPATIAGMTAEEKAATYFQYSETNQVCIMIYPTPEYCLPKKTTPGLTEVKIENLKVGTSYTVTYKRDNTIRCITTPCPENGFESSPVEFVTKTNGETGGPIKDTPSGNKNVTSNLTMKSRGDQVMFLQKVLIDRGFMNVDATGYFGVVTLKAVKDFQKAHNITPTGFVGPITRASLIKYTGETVPVTLEEKFEGTVTAYSTGCFADGECSITVDGKKVVTTIGWSQNIVGKVLGIPDFGSIESNVGAHAKVYAKKTEDGYTLYGNDQYYVEIVPKTMGKLTPGSEAPADAKLVEGSTWLWYKTVAQDASLVTPLNPGVFTLTFSDEGKLSGKTDCNGFFGSYTFGTDGFVKFGPLGSTMMFCQNSQEQVYTGSLQNVSKYALEESNRILVLTLSDNKGKMYFVRK